LVVLGRHNPAIVCQSRLERCCGPICVWVAVDPAELRGLRQAWPCRGSYCGGRRLWRRLRCVRLSGAGAAKLAARLQRSAQTAAASQFTKRANARPAPDRRPQPPQKSPPQGQACRSNQSFWCATGGVPTVLLPRRVRPGAGAPCEVPRSADAVASARSALRELTCGGCLSGALQARSEFRRVATASSIAGKPVLCTGRLVEAPAPGRTRLGSPTKLDAPIYRATTTSPAVATAARNG